jgi:hypothetical protein
MRHVSCNCQQSSLFLALRILNPVLFKQLNFVLLRIVELVFATAQNFHPCAHAWPGAGSLNMRPGLGLSVVFIRVCL